VPAQAAPGAAPLGLRFEKFLEVFMHLFENRAWSNLLRLWVMVVVCFSIIACLGIPDRAVAIEDFSLERYLGTWYEVARLDHRFERGLSKVEAQYSLREDGGVKVLNKGFNEKKGEWEEAEGKAYFVQEPTVGRLKVSFFGPFYGAYNIIELEPENYSYALVVGANTKYLWILAREQNLDPANLQRLISKADELGFSTDELIFPQ
jgi:apolipoprotein D and lipocalin family protein